MGHLLPVMAMRLLQKAGHIPVVLVGGATAQIGDPSGRSTARNMLSKEMVAENAEELYRHIVFRDFLRSNPEAVKKYGSVKQTAALLFPDDIDKYIQYKSPCIDELYEACGLK